MKEIGGTEYFEVPKEPKSRYEEIEKKKSPALRCCSFFFAFVALFCILPPACSIAFGPDAEKVMAAIPMGSKLSDLDQYVNHWGIEKGDVWMWTPIDESSDLKGTKVTNNFGTFLITNLGEYDSWSASKVERDQFSGVVHLLYFSIVIPDDFDPSFMIDLGYIDGVLVEKDWGILPG